MENKFEEYLINLFSTSWILKLMKEAGIVVFILFILGLLLNYWDVIKLENIPISHFVDYMYIYVLLNALIATPFAYLKKSQVAVDKFCPKCNHQLEEFVNYKCPNCGKIKFEED